MASIDKIYGTINEYYLLIGFLKAHEQGYKRFVRRTPGIYKYESNILFTLEKDKKIPICNLPPRGDLFLVYNCEFNFVIKRLIEQYNVKDKEQLIYEIERSCI